MAKKGTGPSRLNEPTLTATDWIEGALHLISTSGLGSLTIDALCSSLGVTKGSFYWHFKNRSELLKQALKFWEDRITTETIAALNAIENPRKRLEVMLKASVRPPKSRSFHVALAEVGDEPAVKQLLARIASTRIAYLEACYRELGHPHPETLAVFAYAAHRGLLQIAHEAPQTLPHDWEAYQNAVLEAFLPRARRKS